MFKTSYSSYNIQNFDFSMKTSSGDKISLSMYSSSASDMKLSRKDGLETLQLSLKEEYGYSFSYKGDGIDEQDQKEIKEALKKIEPLLKIFQKDPLEISYEEKNNLSFDINRLLPTPRDTNHENFIKSKTLDKMDEMLKAFDAVDQMRELAIDVFDMLQRQMNSMTLYA